MNLSLIWPFACQTMKILVLASLLLGNIALQPQLCNAKANTQVEHVIVLMLVSLVMPLCDDRQLSNKKLKLLHPNPLLHRKTEPSTTCSVT